MGWRRRKLRDEAYTALRKRLIRETELAILLGLERPNRVRRIPTIEVGRGEFTPAFAERFWSSVFQNEGETRAAPLGRPGIIPSHVTVLTTA